MKIVWNTYDFATGTIVTHEREIDMEQVARMNPLMRLLLGDNAYKQAVFEEPAATADPPAEDA